MEYAATAHNRTVYASPPLAARATERRKQPERNTNIMHALSA
jgi:hypothetical protein